MCVWWVWIIANQFNLFWCCLFSLLLSPLKKITSKKKSIYTHIFSILPALPGWYIYSKVIWTVGCQLTFLIMPLEMVTQYLTLSLPRWLCTILSWLSRWFSLLLNDLINSIRFFTEKSIWQLNGISFAICGRIKPHINVYHRFSLKIYTHTVTHSFHYMWTFACHRRIDDNHSSSNNVEHRKNSGSLLFCVVAQQHHHHHHRMQHVCRDEAFSIFTKFYFWLYFFFFFRFVS